MRTVSSVKFDSIIGKSIEVLCKCSECGYPGADVLVSFRLYGQEGARVKCPKCGFETKFFHTHDCFFDAENGRLGTPVTHKSLLKGILNAVKHWNDLKR